MGLFSRTLATTLPVVPKAIVGKVASRYVAGETLEEAVEVIEALNGEGARATVDVLGEEVFEREKATASVEEYVKVIDTIAENDLDANVSIKLTMMGLKIDYDFCRDNVRRILEAAKPHGMMVRIDMEDRTTTDDTLRLYRELHAELGNVGTVLQAYMRRTLADIGDLPAEGANIRLCKGIYIEPRSTAWKGYETVRLNFVAALHKMIRQGVYAAIATHDEYLVAAAVDLLDRYEVAKERYEFQMLLGVDDELRRILLAEGHPLRVYVPYGTDWYPYSIRRLRENPEVASHVMKATLSRTFGKEGHRARPPGAADPRKAAAGEATGPRGGDASDNGR